VIGRREHAPASLPGRRVATEKAMGAPVARRVTDPRAVLGLLLATLAAMAWAALWLWSLSPWSRYLGNDGWTDSGALATLCRAVPQGDIVVPAALHAIAWVVMIAAMMLPTTLPLLVLFRRITQARSDRTQLAALVVLGFFAAWFAFGVVAHLADTALRSVAAGSAWFIGHGWMVAAAVLIGGGLFQFSALKYRCLEQCHTPFAFVASRWHGRAPRQEALRVGFDHGVFCVGCCWALMLLMFVFGMGNLGWMLVLAGIMAAEKNLPWGRRLRTPLGIGLVLWGCVLVYLNS
jgi:predicted metal-binding membrane protein